MVDFMPWSGQDEEAPLTPPEWTGILTPYASIA